MRLRQDRDALNSHSSLISILVRKSWGWSGGEMDKKCGGEGWADNSEKSRGLRIYQWLLSKWFSADFQCQLYTLTMVSGDADTSSNWSAPLWWNLGLTALNISQLLRTRWGKNGFLLFCFQRGKKIMKVWCSYLNILSHFHKQVADLKDINLLLCCVAPCVTYLNKLKAMSP